MSNCIQQRVKKFAAADGGGDFDDDDDKDDNVDGNEDDVDDNNGNDANLKKICVFPRLITKSWHCCS